MSPLFSRNLCREIPAQILNQCRPTRRTGAMTWRPDPEKNRAQSHLRTALSDLAKAAHAKDLNLLGQPELLEQLDSVEALIFDLERRRQIRIERLLEYLSRATKEVLGRVKDLSRQLEAEADIDDGLSVPPLVTQPDWNGDSRLIVAMLRMIAGHHGPAVTTIHCAPTDVTQDPVLHLELLYADLESIQRATLFDAPSVTIAKQFALLDRVRSYSRAVPLELQEPILLDVLLHLGDSHHRRNLLGDPTARDKILTEALRLAEQHCEHRPLCPRVARIRAEVASKAPDMQDCLDYHESLEFAASAWDTAIIRGATLPSDYCSASRAFLEWAQRIFKPIGSDKTPSKSDDFATRALNLAIQAFRALPTCRAVVLQLGSCLTYSETPWLKGSASLSLLRETEQVVADLIATQEKMAEVVRPGVASAQTFMALLRLVAEEFAEDSRMKESRELQRKRLWQAIRLSNHLRRQHPNSLLLLKEHCENLKALAWFHDGFQSRTRSRFYKQCYGASVRLTLELAKRLPRSRTIDLEILRNYRRFPWQTVEDYFTDHLQLQARWSTRVLPVEQRLEGDVQHPSVRLQQSIHRADLCVLVDEIEALEAANAAPLEIAGLCDSICRYLMHQRPRSRGNSELIVTTQETIEMRRVIKIWRSTLERCFREEASSRAVRNSSVELLQFSCKLQLHVDDGKDELQVVADFEHLLAVHRSILHRPARWRSDGSGHIQTDFSPERWANSATSTLGARLLRRYEDHILKELISIEPNAQNIAVFAEEVKKLCDEIWKVQELGRKVSLWRKLEPTVLNVIYECFDHRIRVSDGIWTALPPIELIYYWCTFADLTSRDALPSEVSLRLSKVLEGHMSVEPKGCELHHSATEALSAVIWTKLREMKGADCSIRRSEGQRLWELLIRARTRFPGNPSVAAVFVQNGIKIIRFCMPECEEYYTPMLVAALRDSNHGDFSMGEDFLLRCRGHSPLEMRWHGAKQAEAACKLKGFEHRGSELMEQFIALIEVLPAEGEHRAKKAHETGFAWSMLGEWHQSYGDAGASRLAREARLRAISYYEAAIADLIPGLAPRMTHTQRRLIREGTLILHELRQHDEDVSDLEVSANLDRAIRYLGYCAQIEPLSEHNEIELTSCLGAKAFCEHRLGSPAAIEWGRKTLDQIAEMRKKGIELGEEREALHKWFEEWLAKVEAEQGSVTE